MKTTQKIARGLALFGLALTLAACSDGKLEKTVAAANAACPYALGQTGELTGVTLEDGRVVFTYFIDEDVLPLATIDGNAAHADRLATALLKSPDGDTKELLAVLKAEGRGLRFVFSSRQSGKTVVSDIGADRLKKLDDKTAKKAAAPVALPDTTQALAARVAAANRNYPQRLGNGMTLERIEVEGGYLVFHCALDETVLRIADVEANAESVKKSMLKTLPALKDFTALCKAYGKGIIYRYRGEKSGNTFGIVITTAELNK